VLAASIFSTIIFDIVLSVAEGGFPGWKQPDGIVVSMVLALVVQQDRQSDDWHEVSSSRLVAMIHAATKPYRWPHSRCHGTNLAASEHQSN